MFDMRVEARAIAQADDVDWTGLEGSSVFVTGATGLVGSALVRTLLERNRIAGAGIAVRALVRDRAKAEAVFDDYSAADGLSFVEGDVAAVAPEACAADYFVHAACPVSYTHLTLPTK